MAIDTVGLMSLKGNLIVGVKTVRAFTLKDMVRLKKAIADGIYDESYDVNKDGVLDDIDIDLLYDIILGQLFP